MKPLNALVSIAVLCGAVGSAVLGHSIATGYRDKVPPEDDLLFLPRPEAIRAMSLGYHEFAADIVYLRAVLYFGAQVQGQHNFGWLENFLQTTIDLDPNWKKPYRWAGVATMYNGTPITRERVLASSRFLKAGIEKFPGDWELPFMLGCNLLFEMKPQNEAEKAKFTSEGAEWIRRSALVGGSPPWAALLAATILRREGREDAALRHLEQVYYATSDERTREEVKRRLISLKAKIDFEREGRERKRFEEAWQGNFPYATRDLFVLLGPKTTPQLDWRRLTEEHTLGGSADGHAELADEQR